MSSAHEKHRAHHPQLHLHPVGTHLGWPPTAPALAQHWSPYCSDSPANISVVGLLKVRRLEHAYRIAMLGFCPCCHTQM